MKKKIKYRNSASPPSFSILNLIFLTKQLDLLFTCISIPPYVSALNLTRYCWNSWIFLYSDLLCRYFVWYREMSGVFWTEQTVPVCATVCTPGSGYDEACWWHTSWLSPAPFELLLLVLPNLRAEKKNRQESCSSKLVSKELQHC